MENYFASLQAPILEKEEEWEKEKDKAEETELVLCKTQIKRERVKECKFENLSEEYTLEIYDTADKVALYAAKTGEVLNSSTLEVPGGDCPSSHFFTEGKFVDSQEGSDLEQTVKFVKPYIEPEA